MALPDAALLLGWLVPCTVCVCVGDPLQLCHPPRSVHTLTLCRDHASLATPLFPLLQNPPSSALTSFQKLSLATAVYVDFFFLLISIALRGDICLLTEVLLTADSMLMNLGPVFPTV